LELNFHLTYAHKDNENMQISSAIQKSKVAWRQFLTTKKRPQYCIYNNICL